MAGAAAGGASLAAAAYPLAAAIFGATGLRAALLAGAVNSLAVWLGGYLLFATAGAAFPEQVCSVLALQGGWVGASGLRCWPPCAACKCAGRHQSSLHPACPCTQNTSPPELACSMCTWMAASTAASG